MTEIKAEVANKAMLEEELLNEQNLSFIRKPRDETVIFRDAKYIGLKTIVNGKYGTTYKAHVWKVTYIQSNGVKLYMPNEGLLQIKIEDWMKSHLGNTKEAFKGTVIVVFTGTVPVSVTICLEPGSMENVGAEAMMGGVMQ